ERWAVRRESAVVRADGASIAGAGRAGGIRRAAIADAVAIRVPVARVTDTRPIRGLLVVVGPVRAVVRSGRDGVGIAVGLCVIATAEAGLSFVRVRWTLVAGIRRAVAIRVNGTGVRGGRTRVAHIAHAVVVGIDLQRVPFLGAVVAGVAHAVARLAV